MTEKSICGEEVVPRISKLGEIVSNFDLSCLFIDMKTVQVVPFDDPVTHTTVHVRIYVGRLKHDEKVVGYFRYLSNSMSSAQLKQISPL